jgi:hypothetical protein
MTRNWEKTRFKEHYLHVYVQSGQCPATFRRDTLVPCVEAGKNTSTVIPAIRKRRRRGNRISLR